MPTSIGNAIGIPFGVDKSIGGGENITDAMLTEDGLYYMASEDEANIYLELV